MAMRHTYCSLYIFGFHAGNIGHVLANQEIGHEIQAMFAIIVNSSHTTSPEPRKKPWLVGLYRGLYYPVI